MTTLARVARDSVAQCPVGPLHFALADIAVNVDNANTPHYKRLEVDFLSGLKEALASGGDRTQLSQAVRSGSTREYVIEDESFNNDENSVDIAAEMGLLARNSVDRATSYSLMQKKLRTYKMVMRDGR